MSNDLRDSIEETKRLIERSVLPNEKVSDGALLMALLFNQLTIMSAMEKMKKKLEEVRNIVNSAG